MAHLSAPDEGSVRTSGENLRLFTDRITIKLNPGHSASSVGGCQWCVMPMSELIYFEVAVLADRGALSIGVTSKSTSLRGHAGREAGKAFGWASKGDLFDNGKIAERLGAYTTGDIVGLGYNEGAESVFWTKNGRLVQTIRPVPRSFGELVPTITIEGAGSAARFNYIGDFEFKQKEEGRAGERRRVALNPLPPSLVKGGSSSRSMAMTARSPKAEQDLLGPHLRCRCHKRVKLMRDKCSFTEFSKLERSSILQPRALGTDLASPEPACSRLADYIIVQGVRPFPCWLGYGGFEQGEEGSNVAYFECTVVHAAELPYDQAGADVYVGLAERGTSGLPGLEDCQSIAMWGGSGAIFSDGEEVPRLDMDPLLLEQLRCGGEEDECFGWPAEPAMLSFADGDIIGCGVHLTSGRCFFTLNGLFAGWAGGGEDGQGWLNSQDEERRLYPVVAFRARPDVLSLNLQVSPGKSLRPFCFDLATLKAPPPASSPAESPCLSPSDGAGGTGSVGSLVSALPVCPQDSDTEVSLGNAAATEGQPVGAPASGGESCQGEADLNSRLRFAAEGGDTVIGAIEVGLDSSGALVGAVSAVGALQLAGNGARTGEGSPAPGGVGGSASLFAQGAEPKGVGRGSVSQGDGIRRESAGGGWAGTRRERAQPERAEAGGEEIPGGSGQRAGLDAPCVGPGGAGGSPRSRNLQGGRALSARMAQAGGRSGSPRPGSGRFLGGPRPHGGPKAWRAGRVLGQGAFGKVMEAMDEESGQFLAVKQVELFGSPAQVEQRVEALQREVDIMAQLEHPNIVRYRGTARRGDLLFIFLELSPKGSIAGVVASFGPLNEAVARNYTRQILLGLDFLHSQLPPIIHRDIKGANVLLWANAECKLADFGASKRLNQLRTGTNENRTLIGTPFWMAPEVIRESGHGRKADVWSVGCTVIEMMCGRAPWSDLDSPISALFQIASSENLPALPEGASPACLDLIRATLTRDPELRPSAADLLHHPWLLSASPAASSG